MALEPEAIESRLEGLKLDDRRSNFDSKIRAFRRQSKLPITAGDVASKSAAKLVPDEAIDRMVSLLEELSSRIDGLEMKDQALSEELRRRARQERNRLAIFVASGLSLVGLVVLVAFFDWQ